MSAARPHLSRSSPTWRGLAQIVERVGEPLRDLLGRGDGVGARHDTEPQGVEVALHRDVEPGTDTERPEGVGGEHARPREVQRERWPGKVRHDHVAHRRDAAQHVEPGLERADAGKPPSLDSLRLRADIQIAQKKFADAVVTLQQAIAVAPRDAQLIGGLGRVYLQKRDFALAEKELKAALQIDPKNLVYWKDLSSTYYLSGNCPATLATLDIVAKVEPPGSGAWFIRALCYDKLHQFKPALEAYDKFLALEQGKASDQIWQAQQRSKVLRHMLEAKR